MKSIKKGDNFFPEILKVKLKCLYKKEKILGQDKVVGNYPKKRRKEFERDFFFYTKTSNANQ